MEWIKAVRSGKEDLYKYHILIEVFDLDLLFVFEKFIAFLREKLGNLINCSWGVNREEKLFLQLHYSANFCQALPSSSILQCLALTFYATL